MSLEKNMRNEQNVDFKNGLHNFLQKIIQTSKMLSVLNDDVRAEACFTRYAQNSNKDRAQTSLEIASLKGYASITQFL